MSRAAFKNKLAKAEYQNQMTHHRANLLQISRQMRQSQQQLNANSSYKEMLRSNSKGQYLKMKRNKEIELENSILKHKMDKIKKQNKPRSFWLEDYSHSLNKTFRQNYQKSIDSENDKIAVRIIQQQPSISFSKIKKDQEKHRKWISNFSQMEKYRLPSLEKIEKADKVEKEKPRKITKLNQSDNGKNYRYKRMDIFLNFMEENPQEIPIKVE